MCTRKIAQVFEQYQRARLIFVQSVAEIAQQSQNIEHLHSANAVALLRPLLSDIVPTIQETAAVAIGRMAIHDENVAKDIVEKDVIREVLRAMGKQNKFFKKPALFILRAISKHSASLAQVVVQAGGVTAMVTCLEDFDAGVKEAAAWAIGYVARHDKDLAQAVIDAGAVPLLCLCLQEPELCLKQVAASSLSDICRHTTELAQMVVDAGCVPFLAKCIDNIDAKLKRQVFCALANIAMHSQDLAEIVVQAEVFPGTLLHLAHTDDVVKRNAAILVREVAKHSLELAKMIVNCGGIGALLELIGTTKGSTRLPGITALGFLAAHCGQIAMAIVNAKGMVQLALVLSDTGEESHVLAATGWTIGQIGKHTPEHAKAVAVANIFPKLLLYATCTRSSEDLMQKCQFALKQVLLKCTYVAALEPLLYDAPPEILKYVVNQYSKVLPHDPYARRVFVSSGGLRKLQEIQAEPGSTLRDYIMAINCCFPEELVRYYSPGYPEVLLDQVEQYQPRPCAFMNRDEDGFEAEMNTEEGAEEAEGEGEGEGEVDPGN